MILFLAGTSDSRAVAGKLKEAGISLVLSTVSPYGRVLAEAEGLECRDGALDTFGLVKWLQENKANLLIDGTHPYAIAASQTAMDAAEAAGISYVRLERPEKEIKEASWIHRVQSTEEAAEKAFQLGSSVLLTTGSRTLSTFMKQKPETTRLIARILPEPEGMTEARNLGFLPRDIIGMEGPFSVEMNQALIHHVQADVMVMKNSGDAGGTFEKLAACEKEKISAVVIDRPQLKYPLVFEDGTSLLQYIKQNLSSSAD